MSKSAGHIVEIWRHPVSSVGGERLSQANLIANGIVGDRSFTLIDTATGLTAAPEMEARWRKALHLSAAGISPVPILNFPSGDAYALDDPMLKERLTDYFGFPCAAARYGNRPDADFPTALNRYTPAPVHVVTTASLSRLSALCGVESIDVRRFRPTVLIETPEGEGLVEDDWIGKKLRFGGVLLVAKEKTRRCGMTLLSQPGLEEEPIILRTLLRHTSRNFGIYCDVIEPGSIEAGDNISVCG